MTYEEYFASCALYEGTYKNALAHCWDAAMYEAQQDLKSRMNKGGYAVVPVEPTEAMERAAYLIFECFDLDHMDYEKEVYKAMIQAAQEQE